MAALAPILACTTPIPGKNNRDSVAAMIKVKLSPATLRDQGRHGRTRGKIRGALGERQSGC